MPETPLIQRLGATPAKLAIVAALAVVLVGAIVLQWPAEQKSRPTLARSNASARNSRRPAASPPGAKVSGSAPAAAPTSSGSPQRQAANYICLPWPQFRPEEVATHNPFLLPQALRPPQDVADGGANPQDSSSQQILHELTQAEGAIVLMVGNERVARIGAKRIRAGEKFGPYRVSKIDATGVWLVDERLAAQ